MMWRGRICPACDPDAPDGNEWPVSAFQLLPSGNRRSVCFACVLEGRTRRAA